MTSGICGGGGPHLQPQQGRPVYYQMGPFAARLAPSLIQKMLQEPPTELWVGLFVQPPNADGDGYVELSGENYRRVPVTLTPFSTQFEANADEVLFEFDHGVAVTHLGLFDAEGRLRFYGFLDGYQVAAEPPREIRLRAFDMKVRRPPIFYALRRN